MLLGALVSSGLACRPASHAGGTTASPASHHGALFAASPARRPVGHAMQNGCSNTGFSYFDLGQQALNSASAQMQQSLVESLCTDASQLAFQYLVECALPAGANVSIKLDDGTPLSFDGAAGLGTGWQDGPCDQDCQEAVSGCMLARLNYYPVHVRLYLVWDDGGPRDPALDVYPVQEGAFFGNLFLEPQVGYGCHGVDTDPLFAVLRRCSQPEGGCYDIKPVGSCLSHDGLLDVDTMSHACTGVTGEGAITDCHARLSDQTGAFDPMAPVYKHPMTVYLPRSDFSPPGWCGE
jgi:hypothetical protein